jgi:hypothetical protein
MSFSELTGSIFIRSQVIEQLMRQLLESHGGYHVPDNFDRKTFGQLLIDFSQTYPDIKTPENEAYPDMTLYSSLEIARDIRNDAAHGYYLIGLGVAEMLDGYGSKVEIDRYNLRTLQKSLMSIDQCIFELIEYIQTNNLPIDLERPSAIEK